MSRPVFPTIAVSLALLAGGHSLLSARDGGQAQSSPNSSPALSEPAARDDAAVRAAATGVFAFHLGKGGQATGLTPAFQAAWDHALGPEGAMDYDPFCECQDFGEVSVRIDTVAISGDSADVRLTLRNFEESTPKHLSLRKTGETWLLDDINDGDQPSLRRAMAEGPAGGYNAF